MKYETYLSFSPNSSGSEIFACNSNPSCELIKESIGFALNFHPSNDAVQNFLLCQLPRSITKVKCVLSIPATISRGQSRAHDVLLKSIVSFNSTCCFFQADIS